MNRTRVIDTIRKLRLNQRAETALEFALIASVLFLLLMAMFTFALDMFWQGVLDDAVRNAARQVEVDKVTTSSDFVTAVCNELGAVTTGCSTHLNYSVQQGTYLGAITPATLSSSGSLGTNTFPGTIVVSTANSPEFLLVQVAYPIPFKFFGLANGVATENGTPSLYTVVAVAMKSPCTGC
jgi:Flp pilus assembly protein TadG